jgi:hypothetical protein
MAKVHVARIINDGINEVRVILSNGDELTLLTEVECAGSVDNISTFKIEGHIVGGKNFDNK